MVTIDPWKTKFDGHLKFAFNPAAQAEHEQIFFGASVALKATQTVRKPA